MPDLPGYQIVAEIGRGGMGVAYRAIDTRLDREVAVKVLGPECRGDAGMLMRFRRGCKAAARLEHPNIVAIRALELEHDPPFFVMELVLADDGNPCNLSQLVKRKPSRQVHESCVTVMRQLCEALCFAHEHGMIHRDIKPPNILIARTGLVKIADFELAYILPGSPLDFDSSVLQSAELTRTGAVIGTLEYMSPEQRVGQPTDARSDVYSLCAVAHFMLTGVPPVGFPPPIDVGDAGLSQAWTMLLRKGMAHDPSQRFCSMRDLSTAIGELRSATPSAAGKARADAFEEADEGTYRFADDPAFPSVGGGSASGASVTTPPTPIVDAHTRSDDLELPAIPASQNDENESRDLSEKAANRIFGHPEEHRARLSELCEVRSRAIPQKELLELIARINDWSNKKVAYIRNLGDNITIRQAIRSDAVIADLDVLMLHRRLVFKSVDPRKAHGTTEEQAGQLIAQCLANSGFPPTKDFEKKKLDDQAVPGAVMTRTCDECNGQGILRCGACNGAGQVTESYTEHHKEAETCPWCNGTGYRMLLSRGCERGPCGCSRGTRYVDRGIERQRIVACGSCGGSGQCRCKACGATGELLTQVLVRRRLWPQHFRVIATDSPMPHKLLIEAKSDGVLYEGNVDVAAGQTPIERGSGAIEINSADVRAGGGAVERKLTAQAAVPASVAEWMQSLIAGTESLGAAGPWIPKPILLRLRVRKVFIDTVKFEYGGSNYVIHVAGADRAVFDERVPSRGKALFRGFGSLVKSMWQSGGVDPVQEAAKLGDRFSPKGTRVNVCDHDMRLITLLEKRSCSIDSLQQGYKVQIVDDGKRASVNIRFDGWAVRMISMIMPASPQQYRRVLQMNAQLLGGGIGIVDTTKGKWFCATRALVYDSSSLDELSQAIDGVVHLVRFVKSASVGCGNSEEVSGTLLSKSDAMRLLVDLATAGKHKPMHIESDEVMFRVKCPTGRTQTALASLASQAGVPRYFVVESLSVPASKDVEERALAMNGQVNFGVVGIRSHEGTDHLVLRHVRPIPDCDPEEMQVAIEDVAVLADRLAAEVGTS